MLTQAARAAASFAPLCSGGRAQRGSAREGFGCQTSKTRVRARLEIRTGRAQCERNAGFRLAGLTKALVRVTESTSKNTSDPSLKIRKCANIRISPFPLAAGE